ncbi:MAG: cytochrome P450 [Deltaproteobacteria bacterium]|nr:cytochrome P450 [Deltaproteobacteria bacterium]
MPSSERIYDPYTHEMQQDPYPAYAWFREHAPCAYNPRMDFYALFRFEDVWNATLDWKTFSSRLGPTLENRSMPGEFFSIIGMDPPRHTRVRNIVSRGFTPRRIAALEPKIRAIAREHLGKLEGRRAFDMQAEFSVKFPMDVISLLLGFPVEYRAEFRANIERSLERDPSTNMPPQAGIDAIMRSQSMIRELLAERRKHPQDDFLSLMAEATYDDVDGETRALTDDEIGAFCNLLGGAGAETTTKLIGNLTVYLFRNPDQRALIWREPALIPDAIEEVLRYDAPSQYQGRVAQTDTTWHGVTIPAGARVALVTGSAGRDPREYPDPDRLDVRRQRGREIYFGHGQHVCIGKSLARLEARIALEELRARWPEYAVDEASLTRTYQAHVRGFATVPVRV